MFSNFSVYLGLSSSFSGDGVQTRLSCIDCEIFKRFCKCLSYYMILHVITRYYTLLHVIMCYYMLLHVITCYYMLLHVIHVIACYCMLLHVITCYYMLLGFEFRQSVSSRIGYMAPPTYFEN